MLTSTNDYDDAEHYEGIKHLRSGLDNVERTVLSARGVRTFVWQDEYRRVLGYIAVELSPCCPVIFRLYVAPLWRRCKIGKDLLIHAMVACWAPYMDLVAEVHQDDEASQHFFRANGFHLDDVAGEEDGGKVYEFRYELPRPLLISDRLSRRAA